VTSVFVRGKRRTITEAPKRSRGTFSDTTNNASKSGGGIESAKIRQKSVVTIRGHLVRGDRTGEEESHKRLKREKGHREERRNNF